MSDGERAREILELFVESGELPSATRERRAWRRTIRTRDLRDKRQDRDRLHYATDKFLRRRYVIEPLQPLVACRFCRQPCIDERMLTGHWHNFKGACAVRVQAAE
jgi:hypothetical protein